jgi:hypothetical protein
MSGAPFLREAPSAGGCNTAYDLAYWLNLLSEEIKQRDAGGDEIPDVMFALHAVLETALQRLRSDWYH